MVGRDTLNSAAIPATVWARRPSWPSTSYISWAILAWRGLGLGRCPPVRSRARSAARPSRVRSAVKACSNSATAPRICEEHPAHRGDCHAGVRGSRGEIPPGSQACPPARGRPRLPGLCLRRLTGMACRISELVIDAADPDRLAAFWRKVLGYVELGREDDGSIEIGPPDAGFGGPQPTLVLSPSSDPRTGKLRLHIDLNATDRDQDTELERLLALGARRADVGQTGTESWHVLADPEGNEFCLLHARLQPL